ncbi:MAG: YbhB/YbcL family Raf kinase inhibitor-like protein [Actinomycetota bacterium]|jgi:Raf kinase inhibitor-like YbhB/YbcL family protein|nr:YbhB/YbcL family Raf kinase inhibitor-like protein [Actinomycetota bacterium]
MRRTTLCLIALSAALTVACDTDDGRQLRPPGSGSTTTTTNPSGSSGVDGSTPGTAGVSPAGFQIALPFAGRAIERRYTCDGEDLAPQISWLNVPGDAQELAVVVIDLDADGFVHWVATGLDPEALSLLPGVGGSVVEAVNSSGDVGWSGPCPPRRQKSHRYEFTLYALAQPLDIAPQSPASDVIEAIEGGAIDRTSAIGEYDR